jgi:hypothetical protein
MTGIAGSLEAILKQEGREAEAASIGRSFQTEAKDDRQPSASVF